MKLTSKQRARLRQQLLTRRNELENMLARDHDHGLDRSFPASIGELSMYDNHPADIGAELYERGKDIALTENAEHNLEEVVMALNKMNDGNYGECVVCGQPIPYRRLEAIPWTAYCIRHVPESAILNRRPAEEQIVAPPFGNDAQFDGEDVWQIVESYEDGYVEPIESFLATDLYGTSRLIVRNEEYYKYMEDMDARSSR